MRARASEATGNVPRASEATGDEFRATNRRVAVVGGGLAGITTAIACADAGADVTLYEARSFLGGLTCSFRRGDVWIDNGQHVFLRCCTSYRRLLARLGMTEHTTLQPRLDIPVWGRHHRARLRRSVLPAPLHLARSLTVYPHLDLAQRARFAIAALALNRVDPANPATDTHSFGDWLRAHGQHERAIANLWDLVGVATLNARADDASLALAATVFQIGLLRDTNGGDIGWARVPLQELHGAAATRTLETMGSRICLRSKVTGVHEADTGWAVGTDTGAEQYDDVVLAAPPAVAERLLPADALDLAPGWSARLGATPIVNLHLVLDHQVLDEPFVAAVDSPVQWIFDRTATSGVRGGQYIAVSLSAAERWIDLPTAALRERFLPELRVILPALAGAALRDFFVTRERAATFAPRPGTGRDRPGPETTRPGLHLAGAWTATGWPATMESAVRSGESAAARVLARTTHTRGQEVA